MPEVKYTTTAEELKLPTQGLIVVEPKVEDYVFGGSPLQMVILRPDGQHDDFLPVVEIQKTSEGNDNFSCVTYSHNNCLEITHKEKYGYEINMDDRFLAVGSGTIPGQGNSVAGPAEWARKNGFIKQRRDAPQMTIGEWFAPLKQDELDEGKKSLEFYQFGYEWLPRSLGSQTCKPATLMEALKYAPIQASVDGSAYRFNPQGYIGEFVNYTHEITVFGYEEGKYWKIFDSETQQALKFAWSYPLGFPMRHDITKLNMKIIKKKGQAAIGFLNLEDGGIYLWGDGVIPGGSLFKMLGFVYALAEEVDEWPAPIRGIITTSGLESKME